MAEAGIDSTDVEAVDAAVARSSGAPDYGLTESGFVPKPFSRLLAEKLALCRSLFSADIDLGSLRDQLKLLADYL